MRKRLFLVVLVVVIAVAICLMSACENFDKQTASDTYDDMTASQIGSTIMWNEVSSATQYKVYCDGNLFNTTTDCFSSLLDGCLEVTLSAFNEDKLIASTTAENMFADVDNIYVEYYDSTSFYSADYSGYNKLVLDLSNITVTQEVGNLAIPAYINEVELIAAEGQTGYVSIFIEARDNDLSLYLCNFSVVASGSSSAVLEVYSNNNESPALVLEVAGQCSLTGSKGSSGAQGAGDGFLLHAGAGGNGSNGDAGISADTIVLFGDGSLDITTGAGGNGGNGGDASGVNNPGAGGNGGDSGDGLVCNNVYVALDNTAVFSVIFGTAGSGGSGGTNTSLNTRGYSGSSGNVGVLTSGNIISLSGYDISRENVDNMSFDAHNYVITAQMGSVQWQSIDNAVYYIVYVNGEYCIATYNNSATIPLYTSSLTLYALDEGGSIISRYDIYEYITYMYIVN